MKKKIPYLINVKIPSNSISYEKLHIHAVHEDAEKGYSISDYDKQLYCAIKIKEKGIDSLSEDVKAYCLEDGKLKENIRFQKIRLEKIANNLISPEDDLFYTDYLKQKVIFRKEIIRKEITKTGINANKIFFNNSTYLRTLLSFVRKLDDEITLIRWFIPIKLSFEKCVHIFIRHVDETKFAIGEHKKRTFFKYEFEDIFTLLKVILQKEEENIKNHFLEVAVGQQINEQEKVKDYINNWISYNDDTFALAIDVNGYITKFHQKN